MKIGHYSAVVMRQAWRANPVLNLIVLAAVAISSIAAIGAPYLLGAGVTLIGRASSAGELHRVLIHVAIGYSALWLIGSTFRYLVLPLYGRLEQVVQSHSMADSLADSLTAPPEVRAGLDNSEISFAIDTEAGSFRETLSSLYLAIFPALISLIAGVSVLIYASSLVQGAILALAMVIYAAVSYKLIEGHQKLQSAFFKENMRSFGVLSNSLTLWKEVTAFAAGDFITARYRDDRRQVEDAGVKSYHATRRLYLAQGLILATTICALALSISRGVQLGDEHIAGLIVASVGICVAAITPLQSVGFGISAIAVAAAQHSESAEKIRPATRPDKELVLSREQIADLRALASGGPGRPIWVCGPSGSGKTTVLEGLLGLNHAIDDAHRAWLANFTSLAYAQQRPGLLNANAPDNIAFGREVAPSCVEKILAQVGLTSLMEDKSHDGAARDVAGEDSAVSGGERQRLGLARTLVAPAAALVVLDEPTAALDAEMRASMWRLIEQVAGEATVVIATHDEAAPMRADDRVFRPKIGQLDRDAYA